jgi:hypothetical protein
MEQKNLLPKRKVGIDMYDPALRLNFLKMGYCNPATMAALDSLVPVPTGHVAFALLSGTEILVEWVDKRVEGAVPVHRYPNERTGSFSFTPVLARYPSLKVRSGRIRRIPFRIDELPSGKRFVLELAKCEVILSERARRRLEEAMKRENR